MTVPQPTAAIATRYSFTREDLLKCGSGELDGIAYPRLPLPNMLMLDRITNISDEGGRYGQGEVDAEFAVNADSWYFACHFQDDPVMPGSLALDGLCQLLGFYLGWKGYKGKGRALGIGEVKYTGEIVPAAVTISYHLDIKKIVKSSMAMAIADGEILLHGQVVHTAKSLRVGIIPC
ncbi:MAG: bifunctional 3-hydroxydecanoyl-ACP dehydratase/trans-2-decenoyl-ACP isomerase [Geobacteraceae bacterium]|nr:bifunctional 3-hydroxydecanoyl-ACP dehydratase/trans-2-decenoyl-ACP isomerase [Geobacteraceae bacterium]